tara:strand:- start:1212 stop:1457 length:246 start_codon:yes stop_codon:yes gene_type:complete
MLWNTTDLDFVFKDKNVPRASWEIVYDNIMSMAMDMPEDMTEEEIIEMLSEYYGIEVKRWNLTKTHQTNFEYFTLEEDWSL